MGVISLKTTEQVVLTAVATLGGSPSKLIGGKAEWCADGDEVILKPEGMKCTVVAVRHGVVEVKAWGRTIVGNVEKVLESKVTLVVADTPLADSLVIVAGPVTEKTPENKPSRVPTMIIGI